MPNDPRPSKSQVKRELKALLAVGQRLVELPAAQLARLPLSDALREAIALAQRIRSHEGRRRQIHYVGKLLRQSDDLPALQAQLAWQDAGARQQTQAMHRLETLRDRLIEDDDALTALLEHPPNLDVQALRACIRAARKEARENAAQPQAEPARKHYRALFQMLKPLELESEDPARHVYATRDR